jgi:hypothetical protein
MIIIDENYKGIEKRNGYYYLNSLVVNESLKITVPLEVGGSLEISGSLEVGEFKSILGVETSTFKSIADLYHITILEHHVKNRVPNAYKARMATIHR